MARRHAEVFLELLGEGFAQPNLRPMFPDPPGLLRIGPHSDGWTNATAEWAAKLDMNLQSSTLNFAITREAGAKAMTKQFPANSRLITFRGKTNTLAGWANETGINEATLRDRIGECRWPVDAP